MLMVANELGADKHMRMAHNYCNRTFNDLRDAALPLDRDKSPDIPSDAHSSTATN
jgi:hypothetical protein